MISSLKFLIKMILSSLAQITRIHLVFKIEDVLKVVRREVFFLKKRNGFMKHRLMTGDSKSAD